MNDRRYKITLWTSVIGAIVLVVGGIVALAIYSERQGSNIVVPGVTELVPEDHVFGSAEATVTLVEYGDFQCPACAAYALVVKQVKDEYADRIRFVYRDFPLTQHRNARAASYAAEAAGVQGKYWEFHDLLFERQEAWAASSASDVQKIHEGYAELLGLDLGKFAADRDADLTRRGVDADQRSGIQAGVASTPTFYLNGRKLDARSYDDFKRDIDALLATP